MKRAVSSSSNEPTEFQKKLRQMIDAEAKQNLLDEPDDDVEMLVNAIARTDVQVAKIIIQPNATLAEKAFLEKFETSILTTLDPSGAKKIIEIVNLVISRQIKPSDLSGDKFRYIIGGVARIGTAENILEKIPNAAAFIHRFLFVPASQNNRLADCIDRWVMLAVAPASQISIDVFRRKPNGKFKTLVSTPRSFENTVMVVNNGINIKHYSLEDIDQKTREETLIRYRHLIETLDFQLPAVISLYFCSVVLRFAIDIRMRVQAIAKDAAGVPLGKKLSRATMAQTFRDWDYQAVGVSRDNISHTRVYHKGARAFVFTNAGDVLDVEDLEDDDDFPCRLMIADLHAVSSVEARGADIVIRHRQNDADATLTVSPVV
jgi:hypothetical protein